MRNSAHRGTGGFTLLELLVVIVIIGLLAGYVAPRYFSQVGKSEVQITRAQIDAIEKALDHYRLDTRRYPTTEQGLEALMSKPANEPNWNGPYLRKAVPSDPWGRPYVYRIPGQNGGDFDLLSTGKDGQPGGDVIISGSVYDDEAKKTYPQGWKAPRPYLRIVDQPKG